MCNDLRLDAGFVASRIMARLEALERPKSWLARRLGVSEMWVHRRLAGETRWLLEDVEPIAAVLEVSCRWLLGDELLDHTETPQPLVVNHEG